MRNRKRAATLPWEQSCLASSVVLSLLDCSDKAWIRQNANSAISTRIRTTINISKSTRFLTTENVTIFSLENHGFVFLQKTHRLLSNSLNLVLKSIFQFGFCVFISQKSVVRSFDLQAFLFVFSEPTIQSLFSLIDTGYDSTSMSSTAHKTEEEYVVSEITLFSSDLVCFAGNAHQNSAFVFKTLCYAWIYRFICILFGLSPPQK